MTHFVAFSYGKRTGARVAFHSLPKLNSGQYVQPESSVGDLNRRGESNGCIRMHNADVIDLYERSESLEIPARIEAWKKIAQLAERIGSIPTGRGAKTSADPCVGSGPCQVAGDW